MSTEVVRIDNAGLPTVTTLRVSATGRDTIGVVPTPDDLARQAEAVRRVSIARLRKEETARTAQAAQDEWTAAILDALAQGATVRDISEAAGVTRQWIDRLRRR